MNKIKVIRGDWIAFKDNGRINYGEVLYVLEDTNYPYSLMLITTNGFCYADSVIEVRTLEKS